jgi:hypothetical protein
MKKFEQANNPVYENTEIKIAGVTFKNGRKHRQTILRQIHFKDYEFVDGVQITIEQYDFEGEDAFGVYANGQQVGNIPRDNIDWFLKNKDRIIGKPEITVYGGYDGKNYGATLNIKTPKLNADAGQGIHSPNYDDGGCNIIKWHEKEIAAVLLLVFFFPVGVFLVWKHKHFSKDARVAITAMFSVVFFISMVGIFGESESDNKIPVDGAAPTVAATFEITDIPATVYITESATAPEATEAPATVIAVTVAQTTITPATAAPEVIVYITSTGERYHRSSCRHLTDSRIEITLTKAKSQNYTPCGTCSPPR